MAQRSTNNWWSEVVVAPVLVGMALLFVALGTRNVTFLSYVLPVVVVGGLAGIFWYKRY